MNLFEKLVILLETEMIEPMPYGWFHLMWVGIIALLTTFICIKFKDTDDKKFRMITFVFWSIIVILEILKQINYTFGYNEELNKLESGYQWYAFPFQFCSSPFFALPFVIFLKDSKARDSVISFVSIFVFLAGLSVLIYPGDVFTDEILISCQTMIHHGTQVLLGIFYFVYNRKKVNYLYFIKGLPTFVVFAITALVLDEIVPCFIGDDTFNMWFISRHFPCTLPILSDIYPKVPYLVFLVIYFASFALGAFILNAIVYTIIKLVRKNEKIKE